jgi:hypothetical protein
VKYEEEIWTLDPHVPSEYFSKPGPELDEAWRKLLKRKQISYETSERFLNTTPDQTIRLSDTEFERLGRKDGIKLPGGGNFGMLMVYHNLHCLVNAMAMNLSDPSNHV